MSEQSGEPWKRQKGEGSKAYEAFLRYRDMGPGRSVRKAVGVQAVCKEGRKNYAHWWHKWSRRWHWRQRAQAWDDHVHELAESERLESQLRLRQQEIEEAEKQRRLRREEARAARAVGRRGLLRILHEIESQQLDSMRLAQLIPHLKRFLEAVTEGQRLERQELDQSAPEAAPAPLTLEQERAIAVIVRDYVPQEKWEEAAAELDRALAAHKVGTENTDG